MTTCPRCIGGQLMKMRDVDGLVLQCLACGYTPKAQPVTLTKPREVQPHRLVDRQRTGRVESTGKH